MKKISLYITALVLGATALQSCSDNWENPPMAVPTYPDGFEPTMTLADLKAMYWQDQDSYGTTIGKLDGEDIWVAGTIVSSTEAGNIYKTVVLQDESAAITIGIDTTNIENVYPMGTGMAINVTGLAIGRYNGLMQLGKLDGTGVNRIGNADFKSHTMLDFYSGKIDTVTVTIPEMIEAARTTEGKIKWQSRLVRINDVEFEEAGFPFTNGNTTSRTIVDAEGNQMIVYNSSYADFAYDRLPYGKGSVVGILSCYRNTWQLLLIDLASCIGFDGDGPVLEAMIPEGDGTFENPYNAAGAIEAANAGSTAEVYVKGIIVGKPEVDTSSYGNATYYIGAADSYTQLYIYRGYGLGGAKFTSEDQLLPGKEVIVKGSLMMYNNVPQIGQGSQLAMYDGETSAPSTGDPSEAKGDGTAADPYNAAAANAAASAGSTAEVYVKGFIKSIKSIDTGTYGNAEYYIGDADGSAQLYIYRGYGLDGAKFTSAGQLEVGKEVLVLGKLTTYNGSPQIAQGSKIIKYDGQGDDPAPKPEGLTLLASTSSNGAEGWTLTGPDKWKWESYSGNNYLNISCQNDPQSENLYAISPVINLAEGGYTSMSFMHTAKFQDGGFKEKCQIAVREEGTEAWTVLTFSGYPAAGNWTFVSSGAIDITAYAGKKIQVAFVYGAGCTDKWEINDLTFSK